MIDPAALANLLGTWWFNYDEGNFDVLATLLTDDIHFTCRTDTDTVAWAEFARADAARARLEAMGVILEDTPKGVRWRRKR